MSATELARETKAGEISARETVEAHIRRIEDVNKHLNAVVATLFDEAIAQAAADEGRSRNKELGPLHGVPITIKEQHRVVGTDTTIGLPNQVGKKAENNGPLVARLRQAGAIVLGKTNVSQLLIYCESDNPVYGRTNNPWNLERTPGGSSGGEAAIIAAGGSSLGLGSDLGGSIRIPAHFYGIHSLKPTSRRLTNDDSPYHLLVVGPRGDSGTATGPMARTVADLCLAMDVLAAPALETTDLVPPMP